MTINAGGTLAPGLPPATGTLNITGNLVLTSAATYLVQVTPGAASRAAVSGTASLDGTLNISVNGFTPGKTYTLLTATGGLGGTTFNSVVVTGPLASAVKTTAVAYDANDVFLTLTQASLASVLPPGLSGNQTNVANAINAFINTGAALPPGFQNLFCSLALAARAGSDPALRPKQRRRWTAGRLPDDERIPAADAQPVRRRPRRRGLWGGRRRFPIRAGTWTRAAARNRAGLCGGDARVRALDPVRGALERVGHRRSAAPTTPAAIPMALAAPTFRLALPASRPASTTN